MNNPVFLDTVGLIALWDESDQWHTLAEPEFLKLLTARRSLVTTPRVLLECANAASRRPYRGDVCSLRQALGADNCLIEPTLNEIDQAWSAYHIGRPNSAGVIDHISFNVMRRLGVTQAFTHDQHFIDAGFEVLF